MTWDPETPDAELLQAWRRGDKAAVDELIRRHGPRLYNFFAGKVGRDAEALCRATLQECLAAPERRGGNGGPASFRELLFAAARRQLLDHYRDGGREGQRAIDPLERSMADLEPGMSEAVAAREEQRRLALALRQLPVDFQVALELHHWEGFTAAEIGRVMEAPVDTVEAHLASARTQLHALLERDDVCTEATVEALGTEDEHRSG